MSARNSPAKVRSPKSREPPSRSNMSTEVVPDSEEERVRIQASFKSLQKPSKEVIVISSDEDEDEQLLQRTPVLKKTSKAKSFPKSRLIVESSTETEEDISDILKGKGKGKVNASANKSTLQKRNDSILVPRFSLYADGDDSTDEYDAPPGIDEATLHYDGPKSKKPIRVPSTLPRIQTVVASGGTSSAPSTPSRKKAGTSTETSVATAPLVNTPNRNASPTKKQPRVSKKAQEEARLARLFSYAQDFFNELNATVFGNGLPAQTQLIWNKKLYTTAGKAKWNKGRNDAVGISQIELAPKILDCEERIRKTLAHEMCHLACWIISQKIDENHGSLFKSWANKVTKTRPDVTISTTHDYEINHPYQWQCADCGLIYGRFSKSIKPHETRCGKCGVQTDSTKGLLKALHQERTRKAPQTPMSKSSRMASTKPRDSPSSIIRSKSAGPSFVATTSSISDDEGDDEVIELFCDVSTSISAGGCGAHISDSDSDIEIIALKMTATTLKG